MKKAFTFKELLISLLTDRTNFSDVPKDRLFRPAQHGKKCAFTMAEVLITLGVIGIVAAMTLPTLIQKNQDKSYYAQLKKVYTQLSQVTMSIEQEYGDASEWSISEGTIQETSTMIMERYKKYYKNIVSCEDDQSKCYPDVTYK